MENTNASIQELDPHEGEVWAPVPGYVGLYEVSTHGRVRSLPRETGASRGHRQLLEGRMLNPKPLAQGGYLRVLLRKGGGYAQKVLVHRLVAQAFLPNPLGKEYVHHIDGNRANCRVENLEWVTARENVRLSYACGAHPNAMPVIMDERVYFLSAADAGRYLGSYGTRITSACRRPGGMAGGHTWRFAAEGEGPDGFVLMEPSYHDTGSTTTPIGMP